MQQLSLVRIVHHIDTRQLSVDSETGSGEKDCIESCAQAVLNTRALYLNSTLADIHDPDNEWMFPKLFNAHRNLDAAVEIVYGMDFQGEEEKIVTHLFKLYTKLTNK